MKTGNLIRYSIVIATGIFLYSLYKQSMSNKEETVSVKTKGTITKK